MFQAILHIDPASLACEEREAVAQSLRRYLSTYMKNVHTSFQEIEIDVLFVEILQGSLPTHIIVGTVSGLHRLWGTDHEAILEIIVKGVIESSCPERYADSPFLQLTQSARPEAIMPRPNHWRDDPRLPNPAEDRLNLARQNAPRAVHHL